MQRRRAVIPTRTVTLLAVGRPPLQRRSGDLARQFVPHSGEA
jgi:hypothetical protein